MKIDRDRLKRLADQSGDRSWADFGSIRPEHPWLRRYVVEYTYSVGCLKEQETRLITRAFPTVNTQLYFEFSGGLSEIRGKDHGLARSGKTSGGERSSGDDQGLVIEKRTYIKHGLGSWFDIYQLGSEAASRPIKNLKVDLQPMAIYELFQCSPRELAHEDVQLGDFMGKGVTALMLEEMEAATGGKALIEVFERYLLQHLRRQVDQRRLEIRGNSSSGEGAGAIAATGGLIPSIPSLRETLSDQARRYHKSERWLQKRYAEVYGISFKQIQGNLRFHQTHRELWQSLARGQRVNLTELGYRNGYFDQAHFIKEFRRYTGMTPGQYLGSNFQQQGQYLWYW
jgi:AraC-like DNA-binding protein